MANPVITAVTKGAWVKVATNVTCVNVQILNTLPSAYSWTYRATGDPAPTLATEKVPLEFPGRDFASQNDFDLYVWCDGDNGSVRVDVDFQSEYLINA